MAVRAVAVANAGRGSWSQLPPMIGALDADRSWVHVVGLFHVAVGSGCMCHFVGSLYVYTIVCSPFDHARAEELVSFPVKSSRILGIVTGH